MFAPNSMINLLFANPDDTYFGEGLLQFTDLQQYIWYLLHKNNSCDVVYFIDSDGSEFQVKGFGREEGYVSYKHKFLKSPKSALQDWVMDRLKNEQYRGALVCSLQVFCSLYKSERKESDKKTQIDKPLAELIRLSNNHSKRKGFFLLTTSPFVEDSKEYFLHSGVFDKYIVDGKAQCLNEHLCELCRQENVSHIYSVLSQGMQGACVFLNKFREEELRALLDRLLLCENVSVSSKLWENMPTYLRDILSGEPFYTGQVLEDFFDEGIPSYRQLYTRLDNPAQWERIQKAYDPIYYSNHVEMIPVYYKDAVIQKCLRLKYPPKVQHHREMRTQLLHMKRRLLMVNCRGMNQGIRNKMGHAATMYEDVRQDGEQEDLQKLLLSYLFFCATKLYEEEMGEAQNLIEELKKDILDEYVKTWNDLQIKKAQMLHLQPSHPGGEQGDQVGNVTEKKLREEIQNCEVKRKALLSTAYGKMSLKQGQTDDYDIVGKYLTELSEKQGPTVGENIQSLISDIGLEELDPAWAEHDDYMP